MIKRGEIYYVERSQYATETGNEIYSGRPAIIVSCDKVNDTGGTVEVVYLTTAPKCEMVTHVTIRSARKMSTALCEQISTVSVDRLGDCYGEATESEMEQIDHALAFSLGLPSAEHRPEMPQVGVPPTKYLKMETERDLYKQMYLELLERSIK